jgi:hypothetical protein
VICPHCSHELRYKQRSRRRCSYCKRHFAFEPKANKLHLHDLKVRKLADRLSDSGGQRYTVTQLWYAAARKSLGETRTPLAGCGCALPVAGVIAVGAIGGLVGNGGSDAFGGLAVGVVVLVLLAYVLLVVVRLRLQREAAVEPRVPLGEFREMILRRWPEVYQQLPQHLVDEERATAPVVPRPRIALVCPDRSVLACLGANGVPELFAMVLGMSPGAVPPGIPIVVVHDASADGCRFAARVRAEWPGRVVVDAGLRPSVVLRRENLIRLRHKPFPQPGALAGLGLTHAEVVWLAQGWWSPVAAIGPAQLVLAVTKAVQRAQAMTDPDARRAARLGFLTWPAA